MRSTRQVTNSADPRPHRAILCAGTLIRDRDCHVVLTPMNISGRFQVGEHDGWNRPLPQRLSIVQKSGNRTSGRLKYVVNRAATILKVE